MVRTGKIGVFYPEIVHTKRKFRWGDFVAPNFRVGLEWMISMRFQ